MSHDPVNISDYEEGRAEALGALCSIFTSQQCGEAFLPVYLARFYHALTVGLQYQENVGESSCVCCRVCPGTLYDAVAYVQCKCVSV